VLHEIRLNINSRDLKLLREGYLGNTYYSGDLTWRNFRIRGVAVRSRGASTRDATKLGLTVDFDRYTPGRTFLGLRSLVLDNLLDDPSMLRDILASEVFRRMGQAAPRQAMCRLYLNNDYQGVYAIVENIDPVYLKDTVWSRRRVSLRIQAPRQLLRRLPRRRSQRVRPIFQPRTHKSEPAATLFEPIRRLLEAMTDEAEASREVLDSVLDLEQFVTLVAIETLQG
jgi:spore coat protein CotH